ncbi:MAG: DUF721 domain-containing protein [Rikenellaceae bacterium]|nr:DUF721 domain-containing protein [Rikenellaceae bacterium]
MRRSEPVRIGEVVGDFISSSPLFARKLAEARIPDVWPALVGEIIAGYTTRLEVSNRRLFVHVSSSVARNEVFMRRTALKDAVNEAVGVDVIATVIVR